MGACGSGQQRSAHPPRRLSYSGKHLQQQRKQRQSASPSSGKNLQNQFKPQVLSESSPNARVMSPSQDKTRLAQSANLMRLNQPLSPNQQPAEKLAYNTLEQRSQAMLKSPPQQRRDSLQASNVQKTPEPTIQPKKTPKKQPQSIMPENSFQRESCTNFQIQSVAESKLTKKASQASSSYKGSHGKHRQPSKRYLTAGRSSSVHSRKNDSMGSMNESAAQKMQDQTPITMEEQLEASFRREKEQKKKSIGRLQVSRSGTHGRSDSMRYIRQSRPQTSTPKMQADVLTTTKKAPKVRLSMNSMRDSGGPPQQTINISQIQHQDVSSSVNDPFPTPSPSPSPQLKPPLMLDDIDQGNSKYKVQPRDVVRYQIVKYKVSPASSSMKRSTSKRPEGSQITRAKTVQNSKRFFPQKQMSQHPKRSTLANPKQFPDQQMLLSGPSIFTSPLMNNRNYMKNRRKIEQIQEQKETYQMGSSRYHSQKLENSSKSYKRSKSPKVSSAKTMRSKSSAKLPANSQFYNQPSSIGTGSVYSKVMKKKDNGPVFSGNAHDPYHGSHFVLPPTSAQFSTRQNPRAVFMSNTVIRRPSTGDNVSVGKPKFLATAYTQGYSPPGSNGQNQASKTGPLFFQPTRSTSFHRGFKDKQHSSANRINSPMQLANMGLVSPPPQPSSVARSRGLPSNPVRRGSSAPHHKQITSPRHVIYEQSEFLSQMTRLLIARINNLRQRPRGFVPILHNKMSKYKDDVYLLMPDGQYKKTRQGKRAVEETIVDLEAIQPLAPLELSQGLVQAAQDHRRYLSQTGKVTAYAPDMSYGAKKVQKYGKVLGRVEEFHCTFSVDDVDEVLFKMLIGDGDSKRKGRLLLLSPYMTKIGVSVGSHMKEGFIASIVCCVEFITNGQKGLRQFYQKTECQIFRYLNLIRANPKKFA